MARKELFALTAPKDRGCWKPTIQPPPAREEVEESYVRVPISYSALDSVGHCFKVNETRLASKQSRTLGFSVRPMCVHVCYSLHCCHFHNSCPHRSSRSCPARNQKPPCMYCPTTHTRPHEIVLSFCLLASSHFSFLSCQKYYSLELRPRNRKNDDVHSVNSSTFLVRAGPVVASL